jgi:hypothetical protein
LHLRCIFRRRKNRLLQRFAYAICPLRRDVLEASGTEGVSSSGAPRRFDGLRRVETKGWAKKKEAAI